MLIGIVKKNAILMVDFALVAERERGLSPPAAIREAAMVRFRPITMTTLVAMGAALPLAIGFGHGSLSPAHVHLFALDACDRALLQARGQEPIGQFAASSVPATTALMIGNDVK